MKRIIKILCFIILSFNALSQESDFIIEENINSPINSIGDIACINKQIYLLNDSSKCIIEIDENGNILKELNFDDENITGISCLKDTLFLLSNKNDTISLIYKVDRNNLEKFDSISFLKPFGTSKFLKRSDDFYFSCLLEGSYSDQIIKIDTKGGISLFRYRMGGFIGICAYDSSVYQLSTVNGKILKYNLYSGESYMPIELTLPINNVYGNGIDCSEGKFYVFNKNNNKIVKLSVLSTNVNNNYLTKNLNILFPNPSHGIVNISKSMNYEKLFIFNSDGKLVLNNADNHNRIILTDRGIYIVVFYLKNQQIITERIIIY